MQPFNPSPAVTHFAHTNTSLLPSLLLAAALTAACGGGGGGGGGGSTGASNLSAPVVDVQVANSYADPTSGATKADPTGFANVLFSLEGGAGAASTVLVEYSTNGGATWQVATLSGSIAPASSGVLTASATASYTVGWDMGADLGPGNFGAQNAASGYPAVKVRVRIPGGATSAPAQEDVEVNLMGVALNGGKPLGTARSAHITQALPDGRLLVLGGRGATGATATAEIGFRPDGVSSFEFVDAGMLTTPRSAPTGTLLADTRLLIAGGEENGAPSALVDVYDPVSGNVTAAARMTHARSGHTAGILPNGHIVVVGGGADVFATSSAEVYDPAADLWTEYSIAGSFRDHAMARLADGSLFVVGSAPDLDLPSCTLIRLATDGSLTMTPAATPLGARFGATATALPDGRVLVLGGHNLAGNPSVPSAEIYDPSSDLFTPVNPNNFSVPGYSLAARWDHTATALGDGSVLIVGGRSADQGYLSQTEFFLTISDVFTPASPLPEARADHQVDVLAGGFAVVTGGVTGGAGPQTPMGDAVTLVPPAGMNFAPLVSDASILYMPSLNTANVFYSLSDLEEDRARLLVEWSSNPADSSSWRTATEAVGVGDGRVNLATSALGTAHVFAWDTAADDALSGSSGPVMVTLRLTPVGADEGTPLLVSAILVP